MTAKELLLECKIKLKIESDYALAKALNMPTQRLSEYMKGKVHLDSYGLTRIALTLNRDPISLIAEYEAANEKNSIKKEFWQGFLSHAGKATVIALAVNFMPFSNHALASGISTSSLTDSPIMRSLRRVFSRRKNPRHTDRRHLVVN